MDDELDDLSAVQQEMPAAPAAYPVAPGYRPRMSDAEPEGLVIEPAVILVSPPDTNAAKAGRRRLAAHFREVLTH